MKRLILLFSAMLLCTTMLMSDNNKLSSKFVSDKTNANGTRVVDFKPEGVCAKLIHIEVSKSGIVENVAFTGGCSGNAQGISALIKGMKKTEAIKRLKGIPCGKKASSCPDQLARALEAL